MRYRTVVIGVVAEKNSNVFRWAALRQVLRGADVRYFTEVSADRRCRRVSAIPARMMWRAINWFEALGGDGGGHERWNNAGASLRFRHRGHFKDFLPGEIDRIREQGVDILIRLGGRGIYRGEILNVALHGMVSIHHGDNRRFRGGPPAFWEIMTGASHCGFIVQRLTSTLDGGEVLARGETKTGACVVETRGRLFASADMVLADLVRGFIDDHCLPDPEPLPASLGPIYRMPELGHLFSYLLMRFAKPFGMAR